MLQTSLQRTYASPTTPEEFARAVEVPGVSIVVPMYNEGECVAGLVGALEGIEVTLGDRYDFEFLLVDDGSTDSTASLLNAALYDRGNCRIVQHEQNRGIAAAIQSGIRAARHEIVVSIDSDGSYDAALIGELVPRLEAGVDLVTASPYHPAGWVENVPAWRIALSKGASKLYALVCREKLSCYTSCFRVYRRSSVANIALENERFVGVAELLWKVLQQGGRVVEHPATLRPRLAGTSKMKVVRAACGHLQLIGTIAASRLRRKRLTHGSYARELSNRT
jgi:glycosyltransferase involved in cell wall biosynthesis